MRRLFFDPRLVNLGQKRWAVHKQPEQLGDLTVRLRARGFELGGVVDLARQHSLELP